MRRRAALRGLAGAAAGIVATAAAWRLAARSADAYARYARQLREPLPQPPETVDLIRYATLAANSHNTQPWRFAAADDSIDILPDFSRATPAVDPDNHHLFISLGCAMQNLAIAAASSGMPGAVTAREDGGLRYGFSRATPRADPLLAAIAQRQSTRAVYDGRPVAAKDVDALQRAASAPGVHVVIITARPRIDQVRELVVAGNDAQMADPAFMDELKTWLRFSPNRAIASGDGLYSPASGNPAMPEMLGGYAFDLFFTPAAENAKYARQIDSSAGIVVFFAERQDPAHWAAVGRALQRFALTATLLGLKHAFINQPIEVPGLRSQLASLVGASALQPDMMVRFGHGPALAFSPRRPVASVMT